MLDPYVPTPRERRELGKVVSLVQASLPPLPLQTPVSGSAPTEASGASDPDSSGVAPSEGSLANVNPRARSAAPRPESRRSSPWLWFAAVLALAMATGLGMMSNRADEEAGASPSPALGEEATPAPKPTISAEPAPAAEARDRAPLPVVPAAETTTGSEAHAEPAAAAATAEPVVRAPKPGRLSIAVFPWGDVWIDGKPHGKAPVRNVTLSPGRHKVSAGQGEPWKTRVVRVKEGQPLRVQFDLSE